MYVCLQNASPKKVWIEANEMSISYYSFNDSEKTLWLDHTSFRSKANLFTKCVATLSEKEITEAFAVISISESMSDDVKKYLGI
jgi:hypothetical protein